MLSQGFGTAVQLCSAHMVSISLHMPAVNPSKAFELHAACPKMTITAMQRVAHGPHGAVVPGTSNGTASRSKTAVRLSGYRSDIHMVQIVIYNSRIAGYSSQGRPSTAEKGESYAQGSCSCSCLFPSTLTPVNSHVPGWATPSEAVRLMLVTGTWSREFWGIPQGFLASRKGTEDPWFEPTENGGVRLLNVC